MSACCAEGGGRLKRNARASCKVHTSASVLQSARCVLPSVAVSVAVCAAV